jgi:hypothetical protein
LIQDELENLKDSIEEDATQLQCFQLRSEMNRLGELMDNVSKFDLAVYEPLLDAYNRAKNLRIKLGCTN